jgi:N-acetylglucosamine-6-phosphate deacetylase
MYFMCDVVCVLGVVLVTDAMRAMGLPDGQYTFGKQNIEVRDRRVLVAGTDTLAGRCVQAVQ